MPLRPHYPQAQITGAGGVSTSITAPHPKAGLKKEFEDFSPAETIQWVQQILDEQRENFARAWMAIDMPALENALAMAKAAKDQGLIESVNAVLMQAKAENTRRGVKSAA